MQKPDFTQSAQPLIDHIEREVRCTRPHAELLAAKMIATLPVLFNRKPEFFTEALASMSIDRTPAIDPCQAQS